MITIGLVVAMPEEATHIYDKLGLFIEEKTKGKFTVRTYSHDDKIIHIIGSGIGEISGALATQFLIMNYAVDYIIIFGVVGSLNPNYKCLDIVAVNEIVHYDFSLDTTKSDSYGKYPFQRNKAEFQTDRGLLDIAKKVNPNLPTVKIASGDKFVADKNLRQWIIDSFHADICDMESMGIYYACNLHNIPCLFIKTVSDNADSEANISFEKVISNGVSAYVDLVMKIIDKL